MNELDRHSNPGGPPAKSFALDRRNGKIFGVCAGIADYFGIDPMIVRAGFVIGTLIGFGSFILIYLAIALIAD
jgi:phage shock protein PspC (stress-responsive transcriptional regulator)